MKRLFLILSIAALAFPATALAKGPSAASIDGPVAVGESPSRETASRPASRSGT
jgi:hypothetical protein